jgi:hypothetical protein
MFADGELTHRILQYGIEEWWKNYVDLLVLVYVGQSLQTYLLAASNLLDNMDILLNYLFFSIETNTYRVRL